MTDSVYRKTPLPAKLNLGDRNTRTQLSAGAPEAESTRGALDGVGVATTAKSVGDCNDVMRKHVEEWLEEHEIRGPPPSPEAEQRAMWQWIRDFHKEYNDDWFTRNMPRLHQQFKPIFMARMRAMKKATAPAAAAGPAPNLLEFGGESPVAIAAPTSAADGGDLLSLDAPVVAAKPPAPPPPAGGLDGLLDLGDALPAVAPAAATAPATSGLEGLLDFGSMPAVAAPAPAFAVGDGLLGLDFGGGGAMLPAAAPAPPPAGPPKSKELDLLDLF